MTPLNYITKEAFLQVFNRNSLSFLPKKTQPRASAEPYSVPNGGHAGSTVPFHPRPASQQVQDTQVSAA